MSCRISRVPPLVTSNFTLKDRNAQCAAPSSNKQASRVRDLLRDGLLVRVRGRVSLYEGRGDYQMILDSVEAAGDGALRLAFEALKTRLQAEGLCAQQRKQALPAHPQRIGIITSASGAVLHDIMSVFARRHRTSNSPNPKRRPRSRSHCTISSAR